MKVLKKLTKILVTAEKIKIILSPYSVGLKNTHILNYFRPSKSFALQALEVYFKRLKLLMT